MYTGSDLYIDPTHFCQQRTSGAKNWEAWIKDTRDNEYYRIVLMPDNKWWLAQNVKYAAKGVLFQSCGKDSCGRFYTATEIFGGNYAVNQQTICPAGWVLPSVTQWNEMAAAISGTLTTAWRDLRSRQVPCTPKTDSYGWATRGRNPETIEPSDGDVWGATDGSIRQEMAMDQGNGNILTCNSATFWPWAPTDDRRHAVRCLHP
jgi:uncharacterized protein (TIGR02145 family)